MADKIYHFLSSSAREQYAEDVIRALALPHGAELQFRYSNSIVADDVRSDIDEDRMVGAACIISFLEPGDAGHQPEIIPCRKGKIVQAGSFGGFVVVVFRVEGFLFNDDTIAYTRHLSETCGDQIPHWIEGAGQNDLDGCWAFLSPLSDDGVQEGYKFDIFTKTVRKLSSHFPFNDNDKSETEKAGLNPFYHLLFLKDDQEALRRNFSGAGLDQSLRLQDGELKLPPGDRYYIRIHHYCPRSGRYIRRDQRHVLVDLGGVAPEHTDLKKFRVSSDYDVKGVSFKTLSGPYKSRRRISVALEGVRSDAARGPYGDVEIPVLVPPATLKSIITAIVIGVGVSLPAITGAAVEPDVAFLKIILMLAGGLLTGFAAVYGLRVGV